LEQLLIAEDIKFWHLFLFGEQLESVLS